MNKNEIYVSVDVETSGPIPGEYSLLSIGACLVFDLSNSFYAELKPTTLNHDPEALAVIGFNLKELEQSGLAPEQAMLKFTQWLKTLSTGKQRVIFVGLNAPFDWSFINYYFHKYIGKNPFGFTAIDIKAYFMGAMGCDWRNTSARQIQTIFKPTGKATHNALDDAKCQAEMFKLMIEATKADKKHSKVRI